jgi:hypothetical protein
MTLQPMRRRPVSVRVRVRVAAVLAAVAAAGWGMPPAAVAGDSPRQAKVEHASEHVMPFSMTATMHRFVPTRTGGVQTVYVHDGDPKQVGLVRAHLHKEAGAFARGDYADPATIHGHDMPGLQALHAGAKRVRVSYAEVPNGATITYATADPALVSAIHAWFKAQTSDHGTHATMKM